MSENPEARRNDDEDPYRDEGLGAEDPLELMDDALHSPPNPGGLMTKWWFLLLLLVVIALLVWFITPLFTR